MNPNKGIETSAKSTKRSHSETNYAQNEQAKQKAKESEELKQETAQFKQNQNDELRNKETKTNDQNDHSKNCKRPPTMGAKNNPTSKQK